MKIALVHDYLSQDGGAERVLKAFHELWPEAPIFVLFADHKKVEHFNESDIRESFLAKMPFIKTHYQWYLPFMPLAIERHRLDNFDVVLSSTSAFAKGVITGPNSVHISYCHTPTRYLWSDTHEYIADLPYNPLVKAVLPRLLHRLRLWDKMSADRVDHFIANSETVRRRIQKYYRRDSTVINPPVNIDHFKISQNIGDYFLTGARLVPYKQIDLVIQVFNRLGWPLKIFGTGPELENLKNISKPNIEFLGRVTDTAKAELFSKARAFIHPQAEDFGITPVESMAAGRPVIAFADGGATETVIPGVTGVFFHEQTWEALFECLMNFDYTAFDPIKIQQHAAGFDTAAFKKTIAKYVLERLEEQHHGLKQSPLPLAIPAI